MDIIYQRGRVSAAEIQDAMQDPPSYSAVRSLLRILEEKGHAKHVNEDGRHIYSPIHPRRAAAKEALNQVLDTFFGGSLESAVTSFLSSREREVTDEELDRLVQVIAELKQGGEEK